MTLGPRGKYNNENTTKPLTSNGTKKMVAAATNEGSSGGDVLFLRNKIIWYVVIQILYFSGSEGPSVSLLFTTSLQKITFLHKISTYIIILEIRHEFH